MRFLFLVTSLAFPLAAATSVDAQGAMRVALSGRGTAEVTLTFVDSAKRAAAKPSIIRLDYGQPSLRGRSLPTDSLVPYGKAWRTGANGATMLTTDVDLIIGGASVPKGTYVIQSMPSRSGWKLFIQKNAGQSPMEAAMSYDPAKDFARIDLRQSILPTPLETFTMWLVPAKAPGNPHGQLVLAWGNVWLATDWAVK